MGKYNWFSERHKVISSGHFVQQNAPFLLRIIFSLGWEVHASFGADDVGHDVIVNLNLPCKSMQI